MLNVYPGVSTTLVNFRDFDILTRGAEALRDNKDGFYLELSELHSSPAQPESSFTKFAFSRSAQGDQIK